jgi:peroxiredoxin
MRLRGNPAPDFELERTGGGTVRLSDTLEDGPTVVILNRGVWCSYCAEQLQTFSAHSYDMWRHQDVDILPIMGDSIPELAEMRDRFELRIQLLSDPTLEVAEAYTAIEDSERFGRIPIAGTFVIDPDGVVRYEQVSQTPADRTYANFVRHFINSDYQHPYTDE